MKDFDVCCTCQTVKHGTKDLKTTVHEIMWACRACPSLVSERRAKVRWRPSLSNMLCHLHVSKLSQTVTALNWMPVLVKVFLEDWPRWCLCLAEIIPRKSKKKSQIDGTIHKCITNHYKPYLVMPLCLHRWRPILSCSYMKTIFSRRSMLK